MEHCNNPYAIENVRLNLKRSIKEEKEHSLPSSKKDEELANTKRLIQPKNSEEYFAVDTRGSIKTPSFVTHWTNHKTDRFNYSIGNIFKTKEEAREAVERLKVLAELQRYAEEHDKPIDWKDKYTTKYYLCFDYLYGRLIVGSSTCYQTTTIYFTSEAIAINASKTVGQGRIAKYLFGAKLKKE